MKPHSISNRRIKAVIFDLDGTLIDSIPFHFDSFFELFKVMGHPVSRQEIRSVLRLNTEEIYRRLHTKKRLHLEMEKFLHLRRDVYYSVIRGKKLVFRDVYPALLHLRGYKLGIATNSSRHTLLKSTPSKLFRRFDKSISFSEVYRAKPDPEMLLALARKLRAKPSQCVMIGDSVMDVRAAKRAGMSSIGLYRKTGASTRKGLSREKPDFLIVKLSELGPVLRKLERNRVA